MSVGFRLARRLSLTCVIAACGQMPAAVPMTADQVLAASTIKDSQFDKTKLVSAPRIVSKHQRGGGLYTFTDTVSTTLSVSQDKASGAVTFLLTATVEYGGRWRFYRTASLVGGFTLVEKAASRQVQSCRGVECEFFESVVFELPAAVMRSSNETGLVVRLNPDVGQGLEVSVAAPYVAAMNSIAQAMAAGRTLK